MTNDNNNTFKRRKFLQTSAATGVGLSLTSIASGQSRNTVKFAELGVSFEISEEDRNNLEIDSKMTPTTHVVDEQSGILYVNQSVIDENQMRSINGNSSIKYFDSYRPNGVETLNSSKKHFLDTKLTPNLDGAEGFLVENPRKWPAIRSTISSSGLLLKSQNRDMAVQNSEGNTLALKPKVVKGMSRDGYNKVSVTPKVHARYYSDLEIVKLKERTE